MSSSISRVPTNASGPASHAGHLSLIALSLLFGMALVQSQEEKRTDNRPSPIPITKLKRSSPVDFDREILPLLKNNCLACHNKTTTKAGLVLETPQDMLKGGDSGPVIVLKRSSASLVLKVASHQVEDTIMPPRGNKVQASDLTPEELGLIKLWIDQGAKGSAGIVKPIEWQPLPEGLNPIYAVALAPDGQFAACARANQIFVYHLASTQLVDRLTDPQLLKAGYRSGVAHRDLVHALAFSPDGNLLASGGYREVKIWSRPKNVQEFKLPSIARKEVQTVAMSPDGKWLATAGDDNVARLWNPATGKSVKTLRGHKGAIHCVKFSPDGTKLCSGSADKTIRVWDVPNGKLFAIAQAAAEVNTATWLTDNQQIASGGADNTIRVWQLDSSKEGLALVKELKGHEGPVTALESVPSTAAQILSGSADGSLRLWSVTDGKVVRQMNHGGPVTAVAVRRDGKRFASAGLDKTARLWDAAEGKQIAELKGDRYARELVTNQERAAAFAKSEVEFQKGAVKSAETNHTAQAERVKKATATNEAAHKAFAEKESKVKEATEAKAAAERAITELKAELKSANDAFVEADKAANQAQVEEKNIKEDATATKERIDSAVAAAAAATKTATEARAAADKLAADLKEKEKQATEKANATRKALEETEKELKKAETTKSNAETELTLATKAAEQAANAVSQANEAIRSAEDVQKEIATELEAARKASADLELPIRSVAFSPDNLTLATAGDDQAIHTWSAENGAPFESFVGHKGRVLTLAFAGTNHLLSGAADRSVVSWNLQASWPLTRVIGTGDINSPIADRVNALAFSPDGQTLATGGGEPSRSGEIKLWHVATGRLLNSFANVHSDVVFGLDFSRDGKFLASSGADRFVKVLDLTNGKVVKQFEGHTHHVLDVSWKRDGRTLASSGADNVIKLWDFISGDRKKNVGGFDKEVTSVHFVGYTDQMLATSGDSKIRLLREDGNEVRAFAGAGDFVHSGATTPDGKIVIAGGQESILRVWDGTSGQVLATLAAPQTSDPANNQHSAAVQK